VKVNQWTRCATWHCMRRPQTTTRRWHSLRQRVPGRHPRQTPAGSERARAKWSSTERVIRGNRGAEDDVKKRSLLRRLHNKFLRWSNRKVSLGGTILVLLRVK
jgi:hypothetical protein